MFCATASKASAGRKQGEVIRARAIVAGIVAFAVVLFAGVGAWFAARALMAWSAGRNGDQTAPSDVQHSASAHAGQAGQRDGRRGRDAAEHDKERMPQEQGSVWELSREEQRAARERQVRCRHIRKRLYSVIVHSYALSSPLSRPRNTPGARRIMSRNAGRDPQMSLTERAEACRRPQP
jgi:hypothetical protein